MATIDKVTTGLYDIPLAGGLADATHGDMPGFEIATVRITDSDGREGLGYTFTAGHNGVAIASLLEHEIKPLLLAADADNIAALWHTIWWRLHYGGAGGPTVLALSAADIALWDLKAKRAAQPLWQLLGGFDRQVPCYAGGIDLGLTTDALLERHAGNLELGFRAIKMKVGKPRLREDVERVREVRELVGADIALMVDANMCWTADEAIRASRKLADYDVYWLEEPVQPHDMAGHARVAREGPLPVAAGENLRTLWDFERLINHGRVSFPEPDVTNCGGISSFMKIGHLAEAHSLPVTSHGAHGITVHLLAALCNRSYLEVHGFGLDEYMVAPMRMQDGMALPADGHGHGVDFHWERLASMRKITWSAE